MIIKKKKEFTRESMQELYDVGYIKNTVDFKMLEEKLKKWNEENN